MKAHVICIRGDTRIVTVSIFKPRQQSAIIADMFCEQRLRLLDRWARLGVEYSLTVESATKAKSDNEKFFFRAAMDDVRQQTSSAKQAHTGIAASDERVNGESRIRKRSR